MEVPKDQITLLLDHGLYNSAQILGSFLVSSPASNAESSLYLKTESLVLLGDSFFREREHRRAINTYKQALQCYKMIPKQNLTSSRSSLSSNRSSSPNSCNVPVINENEVKFKIASCHCSLNENKAALVEMEGIPSKTRNLPMNMLLGKLYRISRHSRAAVAIYKECLSVLMPELIALAYDYIHIFVFVHQETHLVFVFFDVLLNFVKAVEVQQCRHFDRGHCPYALEAVVALAELGSTAKDIISLFPQNPNRSGRGPFDHIDSSRWLQRYVEAQCNIASNDYKGGVEHFTDLLQRFPNNVHLLLEIAKVEAIIGKNEEAIMNFEKARSIDPYIITYMDEYAMLLKLKSDYSKLNKLVHDLLNIDPARPEVFVALSVLWERKDEKRALSYAEQSIQIDERHITGYIMKGNLLLTMKRAEAAVSAFRGAQELRPDIRAYQGLVQTYLALSKIKEALYASREAMRAMPQSAKALKLVGDVHASNSSGREKAKKFYESALRLEPGYLGAALALAELHVIEGRNVDAVNLLERYLKEWADDSLHVKLAQVFAATNMLQEALTHYQAALRLVPWVALALLRILDHIKGQPSVGVDPDAPEEDEDNDVEDVDGDQDETELL
ncbi:hypothetical protein TanjilG_20239 [Lupinus angustifolius]|uniref:Anaphase-promoting complex subunit 7 n=1 Tax=Lupinus angustifolius TaxID=3871 RepID=A0A1J7G5K3_LUPAN|nr:hypothetical protein TanjilG_20239 [Lupinus angustifolius]